MSEGRSPFTRFAFLALCLAVTALGLNNTYGDNSEVVAKAKAATCGSGGDCTYQLLRHERSPFSQSFSFQVSVTEKGRARGASADVECKRPYVLLGEYSCTQTSGGLPGLAAPAGS